MQALAKPALGQEPDPFAPYRVVGTVAAILVLLVGVEELWRNWVAPKPLDFISFWGAARLTIEGNAALAYDPAVLHQVQSAIADFGTGGAEMPFPYMPAFLLLVLPFGFLPYPLAIALWLVITLAAYVIAVRRLFPAAGWLPVAFPPVLVNLAIGQNGLLTAAVFAAAMAALPRRPFVAGLLTGLLILKPQLGLLFPIALLAARQWTAIAGAALSSIGVAAAGFIVFGPDTTEAWLRQLPLYGTIAKDGLVGWLQLASVYAAGRQAGLDAGLALGLHALVAAGAAAAVWFGWRSGASPLAKAALLASATALASPYLFRYDQVVLVIPLLWLATRSHRPAILAGLWFLPVVTIAQHFAAPGAININPVLPLCLLLLVLWEMRSAISQPQASSSLKARMAAQ